MRTLWQLATTLLLCTGFALGRTKTDILVMNNGDRFTCEVKGLGSGVLYVSFDYIDGTTSVDWAKVKSLESKQLFVVTTESGSVYTGTLRTTRLEADRPVRLEVVEAPEHETVVERDQIVQMIPTSDRWWQRFDGALSFGVSYAKGNQSTQYNLGSNVAYVRERWDLETDYTSNLASSSGNVPSTRNYLNITGVRRLRENWFASGVGDFLQSSEQGISLQSTMGGGLGRYLWNTNRTRVSLLGGAVWQNTKYRDASSNNNILGALIAGDATFFRFSKTNFRASASLVPALSDPGHVRFNTKLSYYVKIFGDLKWNTSFYGSWDNRPPPGFSSSDYGTSSGVSWTFGLR
jgi:Protein of unknown function, DUF481